MVTYQHGDTNQNTNFSVLLSLRFIDVSSICQGDRHRSTDQTIEEVECTVWPEGEPEQKFQDAADHSSVETKEDAGLPAHFVRCSSDDHRSDSNTKKSGHRHHVGGTAESQPTCIGKRVGMSARQDHDWIVGLLNSTCNRVDKYSKSQGIHGAFVDLWADVQFLIRCNIVFARIIGGGAATCGENSGHEAWSWCAIANRCDERLAKGTVDLVVHDD